MHPDLEAVQQEISDARNRGLDMIDSLAAEQINWRFAPGSWSIAECIEHMSVTNELYVAAMQHALETAPPARVSDGPVRYGWLESILLRQVEPPVKMRFKAPSAFQPASDLRPEKLRQKWEASHLGIADLIRRADGVAFDKVKVQSPGSRFLKLHLGMVFHVIAAHDRRHLWQADQVKAKPGFPEAIRGAASQL